MTAPISYSSDFFTHIAAGAQDSSSVLVPFICSLLLPASVIDVGCGTGEWLKRFQENRIGKIQGLDGPWVPENQLSISNQFFKTVDLNNPIWEGGAFDLCISLEVAEHLRPQSSDLFVKFLTSLSQTVVFSAAIPRQGGTSHLNEQWQSHWIEKFRKLGYECFDPIRPAFWNNPKVAIHYKQNAFIFTRSPEIIARLSDHKRFIADVVHPGHYLPVTEPDKYLNARNIFSIYLPNILKFKVEKIRKMLGIK